ncbi:MAG: menaquinone biosynthesis protein [Candidatus Scalindua sp.]|nr:menaquinone biosynthesis protein [Candidatus Scalindua sp.]
MDKLKIGVVPYLNAKPLIYGLEEMHDEVDLVYAVPSVLPTIFEEGKLDVVLMPSVNYFCSNNAYKIIPGCSISSNGSVESVKLFIRAPKIEMIKVVALDRNSLTSCVLTKIILLKRYSIKPEYIVLEDKSKVNDEGIDAFLIIGDNAMKLSEEGFRVLDLGSEWKEMVGFPFVYAVWVTRSGSQLSGVNKLFKDAKERGLMSLDRIASVESERVHLEKERCLRYLRDSIKYQLGEQEIRGLETFYRCALELGEVCEGVKIEFNDV